MSKVKKYTVPNPLYVEPEQRFFSKFEKWNNSNPKKSNSKKIFTAWISGNSGSGKTSLAYHLLGKAKKKVRNTCSIRVVDACSDEFCFELDQCLSDQYGSESSCWTFVLIDNVEQEQLRSVQSWTRKKIIKKRIVVCVVTQHSSHLFKIKSSLPRKKYRLFIHLYVNYEILRKWILYYVKQYNASNRKKIDKTIFDRVESIAHLSADNLNNCIRLIHDQQCALSDVVLNPKRQVESGTLVLYEYDSSVSRGQGTVGWSIAIDQICRDTLNAGQATRTGQKECEFLANMSELRSYADARLTHEYGAEKTSAIMLQNETIWCVANGVNASLKLYFSKRNGPF